MLKKLKMLSKNMYLQKDKTWEFKSSLFTFHSLEASKLNIIRTRGGTFHYNKNRLQEGSLNLSL